MAESAHRIVADGQMELWRISVPFSNGPIEATNCYVVKSGSNALIVDTGAKSRRGLETLRGALAELRVDPREADYFITHLHFDHVGLLSSLAGPRSRIYLGALEWPLAGGRSVEKRGCWLESRLLLAGVPLAEMNAYKRYLSAGNGQVPEGLDVRLVSQDTPITVGRLSLRAIELPGHTRGHMGIFCEQGGVLMSGDHVLFKFSPSISVGPDWQNPLGDYLDSLRGILKGGCLQLCCAHGEPSSSYRERVEWLIRHHELRLEAIVDMVAHRPNMSGYEIIRALDWNVPAGNWEDIAPLQRWCILKEGIAYLQCLVEEGRASASCDDGILRYRVALSHLR
ncbi:MBL fold metallo-hydrolase [Parvibacter caecicola]|uniref:MBL fold metallo-hydrolase n=1 Tax=Parvibacter caecicola TaxID=747645 RepID=A0A4T9T6I3_9ACTN|nr:MBL fold metallo-hydrolase [Parvibacter caecicola]TJW09944.1 MBL fold metallo-hydrolase [Parvibacter caecicola]